MLVHADHHLVKRASPLLAEFPQRGNSPLVAIGESAAWRITPFGEQKVGDGKVWRIDGDVMEPV